MTFFQLTATDKNTTSSFVVLSYINLIFATIVLVVIISCYNRFDILHNIIFTVLAFQFIVIQILSIFWAKKTNSLVIPTWLLVASLSFSAVIFTFFTINALFIPLSFLTTIPLIIGATNQLSRLPAALFITFAISALTISVDIFTPLLNLRIDLSENYFIIFQGVGFVLYISILLAIIFKNSSLRSEKDTLRINLATQYALVISIISALVIVLVTGVLISQIRQTQIDQVGKNFQTIAENFAKLSGSHLEQQTQKLRLITEQVPIFKEGLLLSNSQYQGDRRVARKILQQNNLRWQGPDKDTAFIMNYLNSPIIEALSRFRGHNSFYNNIILVDSFGGLVASLGQKPEKFYFYDKSWWKIAWNNGLGNVFIGDLEIGENFQMPKLRIVIDIIDHTTNQIIGFISSNYLLRTLIEDLQRFKPETVDRISLINKDGRIVSSTAGNMTNVEKWQLFKNLISKEGHIHSGWILGRDSDGNNSLIGYSNLSTAYNVLSDPLQRLGWSVVVSGSQTKALSGVAKSTKLAMLVGLAAMALSVLGAIAAARVVAKPIENLTETASAMSEGNLEIRAKPAGPEELVALSQGFNILTDQLHKVISDLRSQTLQLAKAKSDAEAATKLKGEFLANMSHEIRTPLNAILGFAEILESSIDDDIQKNHANIIKTSGADLLHLINDILDLSKIEAGRMDIKLTHVDIRSMFEELNRIFSISAMEKNITIEMRVAEGVPRLLLLDEIRLKQVLFNLIGNGVKFTQSGGVHCKAEVLQPEGHTKWDMYITVKDSGIGIDPKSVSDLFDTFRQGQNSPLAHIEGTGLGLSISKNLVEMMNGTITVEGKPGEGATFIIHLPDVPDVSDAERLRAPLTTSPSDMRPISFSPANILVVDDLAINRKLILENLRQSRLQIIESHSGIDALEKVKETTFDAILMDIRMPHMDGYQTLHKLKETPSIKHVPVIAITASGMKEEIKRIQESGFTDYLIRPFSQYELITILTKILPHKVSRQNENNNSVIEENLRYEPGEKLLFTGNIDNITIKGLEREWQKVSSKQSIPDIHNFANKVYETGERYSFPPLCQYGKKLVEYADTFDIDKLEVHLKSFELYLYHQ